MEEFFNSSKEMVQRSETKRSENAVHNMSELRPADRQPGRPVCTAYTTAARSTSRSSEARHGRPERPTDCHAPTFCWRRSTDGSTEGRVGRPGRSTDRRICFSYWDSDFVSDQKSNL